MIALSSTPAHETPLSDADLHALHAYWRAAIYPSSWIYGGVTLNPMTKPARRPETAIMEPIYRFLPMFTADGDVNVWFGGVEEAWGRCTIEGGDIETIDNGAVMIGMGERTSPRSGEILSCTSRGNVVDALKHALELDSMRRHPDRRRQLRDGPRAMGRRQ